MNRTMKKSLQCMGAAAAISLLGSAAAFAADTTGILKQPYLIYPGNNTQMEVLWQDVDTETNTLSWGTDTTYSAGSTPVTENSAATGMHQHIYTITGLQPNTKYYYQVSGVAANSVSATGVFTGSFITGPDASATSVKFLALGDTRTNPFALDNVMQEMGNAIKNIDPEYQRLAIHAGDWVDSDTEAYWTSKWFDNTKTDIVNFTANTPINGVKGNHEDSSGYSTYFPKYFPFPYMTANMVLKSGSTATYNGYYGSFDYGPVHFILADQYTTYTQGSPQWNWLNSDLAATTKPWKILMFHEPGWNSGTHTNNPTAQQVFDPLIRQYGVDLAFMGHSHNYTRCEVYNSAQANGDSIVPFVPYCTYGAGGAPLDAIDKTNLGVWKHVVLADMVYHYGTFNIQGKTLTMNVYQVGNASTTQINTTNSIPIETLVINHFTDVSAQVSATSSNLVYSRATKLYSGSLTITNNGPALTGNVDVALSGIVAGVSDLTTLAANNGLTTGVTLTNATGQNNGAPMIQVSTAGLANGASITVPLTFSNPSNVKINYTPTTLQE
ncbi:MAG TPA: metallophosphoesterase family protein [Geobacteraceae bacterium]|nr:metallophosphoesterase family protein [Geobacteraceae bacterium]